MFTRLFASAATSSHSLARIHSISTQIVNKSNNRSLFSFATVSKLSTEKINQFLSASYMIPHPQKAYKGGEDACCNNNKLLCVADGVGGWAELGVDPGLYSKELVRHIDDNFKKTPNTYISEPKNLIIDSYNLTKAVGSTTCCILTLENTQPILRSSYIGDSGYAIFRRTSDSQIEIVYVSEEQQRSFNFPYQIGSQGDSPKKSLAFDHTIKHNDIIVAGTDGLFDNVDEKQILNCIKPFWENQDTITEVQLLAEIIAKFAYKVSIDPIYNSPFAKKARKARLNFRGGKSDDITVVVAQVKLASEEETEAKSKEQ